MPSNPTSARMRSQCGYSTDTAVQIEAALTSRPTQPGLPQNNAFPIPLIPRIQQHSRARCRRAQCAESFHDIFIHFPLLVVVLRNFRRLVFWPKRPVALCPAATPFSFFFFFFARRDEEIRGRRVRRAAGVCSTHGRAHPRAAAEETVAWGESTHRQREGGRGDETPRDRSRRPDALAAVMLLHACRSSITQTVKDGHVAWRERGQRTASATTTMTTAAR